MKRALAVLSLSLAAACGSEEKPPPPVFGGFTPQESAAVIFAPAVCTVPFVGTVSVSAIGLGFGSYSGLCGVVTQTQLCGTKASSTTVLGVAIKGTPGSGGVTDAGPGTYPFLATPPTGPFLAATGEAAQVDAFCAPLAGSPLDMSGGSITIATVDATHVTGSVNLAFENGSVFQQPFDAAVCPELPPNLCDLLLGCFTPVCVP